MKKFFIPIAILTAMAITITSCGGEKDPVENQSVNINVSGIQGHPIGVEQVRAAVNSSFSTTPPALGQTVVSTNFASTGFTLKLEDDAPSTKTFNDQFLFTSTPAGVNISSSTVRFAEAILRGHNNTDANFTVANIIGSFFHEYEEMGYTSATSDTFAWIYQYEMYLFVDKDVTVHGVAQGIEGTEHWRDGFNMTLKKGWNKVYLTQLDLQKDGSETNSFDQLYESTPSLDMSVLKWYYFSPFVEGAPSVKNRAQRRDRDTKRIVKK